MYSSVILSVTIVILVIFVPTSGQAAPPCPKSVQVTAPGGDLDVPEGVCGISFKAGNGLKIKATFPSTVVAKTPNFVFVFNESSCWGKKFDIVDAGSRSVVSDANQLFVLSSFVKSDPPATAFRMHYDIGTPANLAYTRVCGHKIESNEGTFVAELAGSPGTSPLLCIWEIATKSLKPIDLTVTKFLDTDDYNNLWIFEGTDCSGSNLLHLYNPIWNPKDPMHTVHSSSGKLLLVSLRTSKDAAFTAVYKAGRARQLKGGLLTVTALGISGLLFRLS